MTDEHYKGLVKLYETYKDNGLEILAFPCNQFMKQESGTDEEICEFAREKYGAHFKLFSKANVNGEDTCEVYQFLRTHSKLHNSKKGKTLTIPWNFAKFVIDSKGQVVSYYGPDKKVHACEKDIQRLLEIDLKKIE